VFIGIPLHIAESGKSRG